MADLLAYSPYERTAPSGPTTELDRQIVAMLEEKGSACRPGEIAQELRTGARSVSVRLRVLVARGMLKRVVNPAAPQRGPGSYLYELPVD